MYWNKERIQLATEDYLSQKLSFETLELIQLNLPQKEVFQSGIGFRKSRKVLIVKWIGRDGGIGYGECSARPDPYYSPEFMEAAVQLVQTFILPQLTDGMSYEALLGAMSRIRGWQFTKAAVEFAAHDYLRKKTGKRLWDGLFDNSVGSIPAGISMGFQADLETMIQGAKKNKAIGYQRLKWKMAPSTDGADFKETAARVPHRYYSFDANGTFREKDLEKMQPYLEVSETIEQPFPPSRLDIYQLYKKNYPTLKVCWDEEVKGLGDLVKLHALGIADELNLKPGRVGGLLESLYVLDFCQFQEIPIWVGGMFETGIGRSLNIQLAALMPNAKAHDLSPSHRYFHEDVLENAIVMDEDGMVDVSSSQDAVVAEAILQKYTINQ